MGLLRSCLLLVSWLQGDLYLDLQQPAHTFLLLLVSPGGLVAAPAFEFGPVMPLTLSQAAISIAYIHTAYVCA